MSEETPAPPAKACPICNLPMGFLVDQATWQPWYKCEGCGHTEQGAFPGETPAGAIAHPTWGGPRARLPGENVITDIELKAMMDSIERLACKACLGTGRVIKHNSVDTLYKVSYSFNEVPCPNCGASEPRVFTMDSDVPRLINELRLFRSWTRAFMHFASNLKIEGAKPLVIAAKQILDGWDLEGSDSEHMNKLMKELFGHFIGAKFENIKKE